MKNLSKQIKKFYFNEIKNLIWQKEPKIILKKNENNKYFWFPDGKLNVYQNCITENLRKTPNKTAIITVNQKKEIRKYSFAEIDKKVNKLAIYIKSLNSKYKFSKKEIRIMIHSSASLESAALMLACSKLSIHFSVIFEELEALGIQNRIKLFRPDFFFSRVIKKDFVDKMGFLSFKKTKFIFGDKLKKVLSSKNINKRIKENFVFSNKSLFTLFTSGSTGEPKGITHTTGGYLFYSKITCKKQFGMNKSSIVLTASDAGWINGHTYSLFGPLSLGSTTILVEKPISLIDINLFKKIIRLKTTIIYLPVTLIRLIKSLNKNLNIEKKYIKTLGSMGEPLAPTVAEWFASQFSKKNNVIVNTYFQTETGGIICSPKYNQKIDQVPHGSVGNTISKHIILNNLIQKKVKEIKILSPWPGMMKNIINGKKEWSKYWDKNKNFKLFDLATSQKNNIFIHGRNDDVVNIRGHRIGSEEIESILLKIKKIKECCVAAVNDKLEGSKFCLFIVSDENLDNLIEKKIISNFGTYALPKKNYYVKQLPKTRSGKILRRLLRNIVEKPDLKDYGDVSTILNFGCLEDIKTVVKKYD